MDDAIVECKVCIVGDTDVGKTSISMRYVHGEFMENTTPTIGAAFLQKKVRGSHSPFLLRHVACGLGVGGACAAARM